MVIKYEKFLQSREHRKPPKASISAYKLNIKYLILYCISSAWHALRREALPTFGNPIFVFTVDILQLYFINDDCTLRIVQSDYATRQYP